MIDTEMRALLAARGIRPRSITTLAGGQKNVNQLVDTKAGDRYVVRQYATATAGEVDYELDLSALAEAIKLIASLRTTVTEIYATAALPRGLVHNDISARKLLLDAAGSVTAVLDFDDCMTSFLLFDLGRIIEVWGSGTDGNIDLGRVSQLIDAYNSERAITGPHDSAAMSAALQLATQS
jgi:Ser/Thr protein kinase RdoA (MazF antagonist)